VCSTGELVGRIVHFPDKWWGFEAVGRSHHPAVCSSYHPGGYKAVMVKGTDLRSARYAYAQVVVEPDEKNGLSKTTSFAIRPKVFSGQRISVLDQIGSLGAKFKKPDFHTVGRTTFDRPTTSPLAIEDLFDDQRTQKSHRMPHTALFSRRGNHADFSQPAKLSFQGCQARGIDAVIVGEKNLHVDCQVASVARERCGAVRYPHYNYGGRFRQRAAGRLSPFSPGPYDPYRRPDRLSIIFLFTRPRLRRVFFIGS